MVVQEIIWVMHHFGEFPKIQGNDLVTRSSCMSGIMYHKRSKAEEEFGPSFPLGFNEFRKRPINKFLKINFFQNHYIRHYPQKKMNHVVTPYSDVCKVFPTYQSPMVEIIALTLFENVGASPLKIF